MEVFVLPALRDNYIFALKDHDQLCVIDPAEADPVFQFLEKSQLRLAAIWNTHHHFDHVGGNLELKDKTGCQIVGHKRDAKRIPGLDLAVSEGDSISFGSEIARVIALDGHTIGHIAFYFESSARLFCGDTLFSVGCGRLFEGHPHQMFKSLSKLKKLPDETLVYCAHEYTLQNIAFAETLDSSDALQDYKKQVEAMRQKGKPSIPCQLGLEKTINPFLTATTVEEFQRRREMKDHF